jgi:hypothetical protein
MLVSGLTFISSAEIAKDKAMLLDDISISDPSMTGSMGYIVNASRKNDFGVTAWNSDEPYAVQDPNGISIAFDLNVIATSSCTHLVNQLFPNDYTHVRGLVFTFSSYEGRQAVIYDAAAQEFQIANVNWPTSMVEKDRSAYIVESRKVAMNPGEWHRCFYLIQGTEVFVYCDGNLVISHDFNGGPRNNLNREFLMFWPSHCRVMMDNLVVGTDEYDDNAEDNEGKILFADDFNDAITYTYDHTEEAPTWAVEVDEKGNKVLEDKLDEEGNPVINDNGEVEKVEVLVYEKNADGSFKLDGKGNKIPVQEVDDKGKPVFHNVYFFNNGAEVVEGCEQTHAGFNFGNGLGTSKDIQCNGVDKDAYCGMLKDIKDAVISFEDTGATEGQTVNAAINYDPTSAGFTSAKDLVLSIDPIFNFKGFEKVADGVTIEADENGLVDITLPAGFKGKIAEMVLEIPSDREMAQSCRYRYGFLENDKTVFTNGSDAVDAASITIDGAFTSTRNFEKGDANNDGKVNAKDVILLMRYNLVMQDVNRGKTITAKQQATLDSVNIKAADVYSDSKLNSRDVTILMKFLATGKWGTK